jgi:hypothetical protein
MTDSFVFGVAHGSAHEPRSGLSVFRPDRFGV